VAEEMECDMEELDELADKLGGGREATDAAAAEEDINTFADGALVVSGCDPMDDEWDTGVEESEDALVGGACCIDVDAALKARRSGLSRSGRASAQLCATAGWE
jgi:hypothetical protein